MDHKSRTLARQVIARNLGRMAAMSAARLLRLGALMSVIALAPACRGGDSDSTPVTHNTHPPADTVMDLCSRFDDCNLLQPGISVAECKADIQKCVDELTPAEGEDWK